MRTGRRAGAWPAAVMWLLGACATTSAPHVIHVRDLPERPTYSTEWITSDRAAAAVAMSVMERELGLPRLDVAMHFLPDREAFRQALIEDGYDPAFAEETSSRMDAIAGHGRVFFNSASLAQLPAGQRAAFFAHELTHTLQYELGGGTRGTSDQWLREGFADWIAGRVLAAVGIMPLDDFRRQRIGAFRQAGVVPRLDQMATFPAWVALFTDVDARTLAGMAFLAADFLVDRHGVDAVLDYFRLFATTQDRLGNFAAVFGEPLPAFEAALGEHLAALR